MSTLREVISRIRSQFKFISTDQLLTDRAIAAELKSIAAKFIKQQTDKRKLWASPNLFTTINCLEMVLVPAAECCEFKSDCTIRRSKHKLPKIGEGLYGLLVQSVLSIDRGIRFNETTPVRFSNLSKLNVPKSNYYFWIHNDYLYVTDPDIEGVSITAYFEEEVPTELQVCDPDCTTECPTNPLDEKFKCPGFLEADVVLTVGKIISDTYKRSTEDNTSDDKDDSQ